MRAKESATAQVSFEERTRAISSRFNFAERVLYFFSKNPRDSYLPTAWKKPTGQWNEHNALSEIVDVYPDLPARIQGKRVLDYGCGDGFQTIALAKAGAGEVTGVDLIEERLVLGREMARNIPNATFATVPQGEYDFAISLNAFEHFPEPEKNLADLAGAVKAGGRVLISFGPPWFAPYGAHMYFFTNVPWVHLIFSERTVFNVRQLYRNDDGASYAPGLNSMSLAKFERLARASGLRIAKLEYHAIRDMNVLTKIPLLRELFVNRVVCELVK